MKFLVGNALLGQVRELLKNGTQPAYLAVAFWGEGAVEALDLEHAPRPIYVVCNLLLGGTNPKEVRRLIKARIHVKHTEILHAKVYWTEAACLVGSANASANGLGWEGSEASQMIEAGALLKDDGAVSKIGEWIQNLWNDASPVRPADFKRAQIAWDRNRKRRPFRDGAASPHTTMTLCKLLKKDETALNDRGVVVRYVFLTEPQSAKAKRIISKRKEQLRYAKNYDSEELFRPQLPKDSYIVNAVSENISEPLKLEEPIYYMGDWDEESGIKDEVDKNRAVYWFRKSKSIPKSVTNGLAIKLSKKDREFLTDVINKHHATYDKIEACVEFGAFIKWCKGHCKKRWESYLSG